MSLCPPQFAGGALSRALATSAPDARRATDRGGPASGSGRLDAFLAHASTSPKSNGKANANQSTPSLPTFYIKNARSTGQTSKEESGSDLINLIGRSIRSIFATRLDAAQVDVANISFETLYRAAEDVVRTKGAAEGLYERIKMEMERAVGQLANSLRAGKSTASDEEDTAWKRQQQQAWLSKLTVAWSTWCDRTTLTCHILTVLDQIYVLRHDHLFSIWNLSMNLFKTSIAENEELQQHALTCIAGVCNNLRDHSGEDVESSYRTQHLALSSMFTSLSLYAHLEATLLDATRSHFSSVAKDTIETSSITSYLDNAQALIAKETRTAEWLYSNKAGRSKNMKILHTELIKSHAQKLVAGLSELLESSSDVALSQLYSFLSTVEELPLLRASFAQYICQRGETIVMEKDRDDEMIERLLEYKGSIDRIVSRSFHGDGEFRQAQKESFEKFINKRENKAAELIAKFLDARLRSGNKTMSDQEMEHVLNEALILFRYTNAKDMFEEFYKRLFAKRLLLNRSASSDAEQSMLLKLKEECGAAFTQKLETMLTDIALSDEMMKAYSLSLGESMRKEGQQGAHELDLNVNVLTQAHWPTYPQVDVIIPPYMAEATDKFAQFYETRNQGRKLHWAHSLGTTNILAQFAKAGEKELLVSTFQTVVLLLFNEVPSGGKLSYTQIKQQTGLEDQELKRTLQSLASGQIPTRVLRKDPQGKDVNETDSFSVNEQLKNERKRIRINMIQLNETQEEQKSTVDRVMFDREMVLQATAVRILKAKKTIKHSELLQEIVESIATRFAVDVGEIKKTFEVLIDKEYMERVEGQRGMYRYLA